MATFFGRNLKSNLAQRGHVIASTGQKSHLIIPLDQTPPLSGDAINEFRKLFGHAAFRKMLRKLTSERRAAGYRDLKAIAGKQTDAYLSFLRDDLSIVSSNGDHIWLTRNVDNVGPTLEWYVAGLCETGLSGAADWGVKLEEARSGGDWDVIASLGGVLAYVECKSSAPDQIRPEALARFLERAKELAPEIALLLVDTDVDLAFTPLLEGLETILTEAERIGMRRAETWSPPTLYFQKLPRHRSIYWSRHWNYATYVSNSQPKILTQLRRSIRHYHSELRGFSILKPPTLDFIGAARTMRLQEGSDRQPRLGQ